MRKTKSVMVLLLTALMILSLAGCDEEEAPVSAVAPDTLIGESSESEDSAGIGLDGSDFSEGDSPIADESWAVYWQHGKKSKTSRSFG